MSRAYPRKLYRDDALVLRCQKLGEADRIVTLFTRRHGRVRAVGTHSELVAADPLYAELAATQFLATAG